MKQRSTRKRERRKERRARDELMDERIRALCPSLKGLLLYVRHYCLPVIFGACFSLKAGPHVLLLYRKAIRLHSMQVKEIGRASCRERV